MLRHVVAIVSGGSSGLGAATTSFIIRHGGKVVVADLPSSKDSYLRLATVACAEAATSSTYRHHNYYYQNIHYNNHRRNQPSSPSHHDDGKKSKNETRMIDRIIAFSETDVRKEEDVKRALNLAEDQFGKSVNLSVSCAGICPTQKTISKIKEATPDLLKVHSLEEFNTTIQVNTIGTFNMARLAAERMVANNQPDAHGLRGCIINTSSIAAYEGQIGQVAYAASKSAVVGMTLPMARDLAEYGVRVMTIAPGLFKTPLMDNISSSVQNELSDMVPCPKRLGDPDEFGRLVGCIVTNPMLNGEVIRLDGALRTP